MDWSWEVVLSDNLSACLLRLGGQIADRPVTPGDLAATVYRHFGVPLDSTYTDALGQPHHHLPSGGEPIRELSG